MDECKPLPEMRVHRRRSRRRRNSFTKYWRARLSSLRDITHIIHPKATMIIVSAVVPHGLITQKW